MNTGLKISGLSVARGTLPVCRNLSIEVPLGQVTALLGPNGAGKTTLLDGISGVIPTQSGSVELMGRTLTKTRRAKRVRAGLGYVTQGRTIFPSLTVEENLAVAGGRDALDQAYDRFPRLHARRTSRAEMLSGGEQQMLVIARALAVTPAVLMIDEMSLGLAPVVVGSLIEAVADLATDGVGVLLVEQFAALALEISSHAYVLRKGQVVYDGTAKDLLASRHVMEEAYLASASDPVPPRTTT